MSVDSANKMHTGGMSKATVLVVLFVIIQVVQNLQHGLLWMPLFGETVQSRSDTACSNLPVPDAPTVVAATTTSTTPAAPPKDNNQAAATAITPVDRDWCPRAKCVNTASCQPCQQRFLIILTTGRAASTTLTWMMDALPGVRMAGENNNFLKNLLTTVSNTVDHAEWKKGGSLQSGPWGHYPMANQSLACPIQSMISAINPPPPPGHPDEAYFTLDNKDTILGFKTIRFHQGLNTAAKRQKAISDILEYFPCARILVNYRSDEKAQATSFINGWNKYADQNAVLNTVKQENDEILGLAKPYAEGGLGDRSHLIDSTKWTKNIQVLNDAVRWMGFSEECKFPYLLEFNTKGENGYSDGSKTTLTLPKECKYLGGSFPPAAETKQK
jgi:hypothetical protein